MLRWVRGGLPWVPEAFLARFPVAAYYVLYCDPREKPLDQSSIALMTPSQWLPCLNRFSPEFGSAFWLAANNPPRYSKYNSLCHWLTRIVCRGIVVLEINQVYRSRVICVVMEDCESSFDKTIEKACSKNVWRCRGVKLWTKRWYTIFNFIRCKHVSAALRTGFGKSVI